MTQDPRDLSAMTSPPPARAAGLALPPRRQTAAPAPEREPVGEEPEKRARPPKRKPAEKPAGRTKLQYTAYFPLPVVEAIERDLAGRSWSEWFLDAFRAHHHELDDRFDKGVPGDDSGLPARPRGARKAVDRPTPKQLRLTAEEIAVLESKREKVGSPNRSEFLTVLAELHLAR